MEPDRDNLQAIGCGGRLRWKIENEGFNTRKWGGYQLKHKFARKSYTGLQNYYMLLQIAHAINQLIEKGKYIRDIFKLQPKETVRNLWNKLKYHMIFCKPVYMDDSLEYDNIKRPAPA